MNFRKNRVFLSKTATSNNNNNNFSQNQLKLVVFCRGSVCVITSAFLNELILIRTRQQTLPSPLAHNCFAIKLWYKLTCTWFVLQSQIFILMLKTGSVTAFILFSKYGRQLTSAHMPLSTKFSPSPPV